MAILMNLLNCGAGSGNLGVPTCEFQPDLLVGAIAIPKGNVITAAKIADMFTTIKNGAKNDTYSDRWFIMGRFKEFADNSEARQQKTWAYGQKVTTRDAVYNWGFIYFDGGFCLHKAMLKFKNRENEFDFLFVDKSRNIIGTKGTDLAGYPGLAGIALDEFHVDNWTPGTGSEPPKYMCHFAISDATDLNEDLVFIPGSTLTFDVFKDVPVVKDMEITALSALNGTGGFTASIFDGCGGRNLAADGNYGSAVASTSLYDALNEDTGGAITISTVTRTGTGNSKLLSIDLDAADADYPASGGYIVFKPKAPSVWKAASIDYYEAQPIRLLVP